MLPIILTFFAFQVHYESTSGEKTTTRTTTLDNKAIHVYNLQLRIFECGSNIHVQSNYNIYILDNIKVTQEEYDISQLIITTSKGNEMIMIHERLKK